MRSFAVASFIGILGLVSANAQETPRFTFDVSGGYTTPVGNTGRQLNQGWNVGAGMGMNFNSVLGAKVNVGYSAMGINDNVLANIGAPGGNVNVFTATLDPVVHLIPGHRHLDIYITGGGGLFHVNQQFTQPTVAVTNVFDPFFGFFPVAFGATQVLSSYTVNKPGFDVGAGVALGVPHGKFFMEAKWDHAFLANSHIDYVPVSFGFRF
jgi:hypothetical protein